MIKSTFSYIWIKARGFFPLAFLFSNIVFGQELQSLKVLNSPYDEKHPVLSPDGTLFYSIGFHPDNVGGFKDYGDIWMSIPTSRGDWSKPVKVNSLSTEGNDVVIGFPDPLTILVYHSEGAFGKGIHQYIKFGKSWNYQRRLSIKDFSPEGSYFSGRLDATATLMVLAFQQAAGFGNEDIYISHRIEEGVWSSPINLGKEINSFAQEQGPFISQNQQYLFFSSNKQGAGRGKDIYMSQRLDSSWVHWSTPKPLSLASTQGSDLYYLPYFQEKKLAIFSTTQNSEGFGDFVSVALELDEEFFKTPMVVTNKPLVESIASDFIEQLKGLASIDTLASISIAKEAEIVEETPIMTAPTVEPTFKTIQVLDIKERFPLNYQLTLMGSRGEKLQVKDVEILDSLLLNAVWKQLFIQSKGYIPREINVETWNSSGDYTFYLSKAEPGNSILLTNIQFNVGTADFADSRSIQVLDNLLEFLKENPALKIRFEGHTDNYGDPMLNKELSLKRASKIRGYLTLNGIDFERIRISGWGGTRPIADNATEEGRQLNRRVELLIEK